MPDPVERRPVHVLNGPNLNLLGTREPEKYGSRTLADIEAECRRVGAAIGMEVQCRQSNHEGQLIDWIHEARTQAAGIVINPGAWSHTSVAIMDALLSCAIPVVEVHLTNIHRRDAFRHHSYVSLAATGVICGLGSDGYRAALTFFGNSLGYSPS
ncbi:type II 3-dehydroquinate dehydratase [Niveispirillum sp. KHB5.9]|uniref:type II 3-dehydroquinate dehydratase n=1 Tax=Niveispirillum sp. KHB5.9 TaxID=3400269 RepID=UPI003A89A36D